MKDRGKYKYIRIIGIILFFYILLKINLQELFLTLRKINLFYFLIAIILALISALLGILKWRVLIKSQEIKVSFITLAKIYLKGFFLGTITPGKLGEFWKVKYLTEKCEISSGLAFYTTLMDRIIDLVIIVGISLAGVGSLFSLYGIEADWAVIILWLILISLIVYFLTKKNNIRKILKSLINIFLPKSIREKTDLFLDQFFGELQRLNLTLFLKLLMWGLSYYLSAVLVYYFVMLSLGISISIWYLFLIVALIWLIVGLPITILGVGTREASYIFFFSVFGISSFQAVAMSLLILFCDIVIVIPGAILFFKNN